MKKLILFAAYLFTLSTAVNAQETTKKTRTEKVQLTAEQRAQKNVDDLNATVVLNDEQKVKVKDLALTRITKADAIRAKYKGQAENKETAKKEIEVLRKDYRQSVKSLLTPEQLEKVKAKQKETKATKGAQKTTSSSNESIIDTND